MNNLIKKILVSEKSFQAVAGGKYSFIVDKAMSKESIAKAVESLFSVSVLSVNSMNYKGKIKSVKRKAGQRSDFKKGILSLKPGQKIDLFEIEGDDQSSAKATDGKGKSDKKKQVEKEPKVKKVKENKDVEVTIKSK